MYICIYPYLPALQKNVAMISGFWLCVCVGGGGGGGGGEVNWGESLNKKFAAKFFFRIYKFLKTCKKIYLLIKLM